MKRLRGPMGCPSCLAERRRSAFGSFHNTGFRGRVRVTADNLPHGVTARPLILSGRHKEGLLILSAQAEIDPTHASIRVSGVAEGSGVSRIASTGAIIRGVNNADNEATQSRLTADLALAVVGAPSLPVTLDVPTELVTSIGGRLRIPVKLERIEAWKDREIEVRGGLLPSGVKVAATKTKANAVEIIATVEDAKLPPGTYSFPVATKLKDKRPRNERVFREAESDLQKVSDVEAEQAERLRDAESRQAVATAALSQVRERHEALKLQTAEPRNKLLALLQEQQKLANRLATSLKQAIDDPADDELQKQITDAETAITSTEQRRRRTLGRSRWITQDAFNPGRRCGQSGGSRSRTAENGGSVASQAGCYREEESRVRQASGRCP